MGTVQFTEVDAAAFPQMTAYLVVNTAAGKHLPGLGASAFGLSEGGAPATGLTVEEQTTGVRVVFALDPSEPFDARDAAAVTRLDYLRQALIAFAREWMRAEADQVTIVVPEGDVVQGSSSPDEVAAALEAMTGPLAQAADPLAVLNRALDYAAEASPRPGMQRYVVFISNGFELQPRQAEVNDWAVRARAAQVTLHAVYVGPAAGAELPAGRGLESLAGLTRGRTFLFDKPASLTPLYELLADQRTHYLLAYRSKLNATGQYDLSASVTLSNGATLTSEPQTVALRIEPPHILLGEVPTQVRQGSAALLIPFTVDFPDSHPRELREYQLIVDGEVAGSETAAGDGLRWSTTGYSQTRAHTLFVRVTDELGITSESAPVTVTVTVEAATAAARTLLSPAVLAALGTVGVLLVIVLFVAWRRRARPTQSMRAAMTVPAAPPVMVRPAAPVSAPAPESSAPPKVVSAPKPTPHVADDTQPVRPMRIAAKSAPPASPPPVKKELGRAYFEVLETGGGSTPRADVELLGFPIRLGRDPARAQIVFDDRSVSRLHARLEERDGLFTLYDEQSASGTWVNLEQIPAEGGRALKDGDVINLGRVQLRFKRRY